MHKLAIEIVIVQEMSRKGVLRYSFDMGQLEDILDKIGDNKNVTHLTAKELVDFLDGRGELATALALVGSRKTVDDLLYAIGKYVYDFDVVPYSKSETIGEDVEFEKAVAMHRAYVQHQP